MTTEADKQKARECAVQVLRNCASHYATPGRYITSGAEQPQKFIDRAIDNATPIVAAYGRQRYREGLEAARLAQCSACRSGLDISEDGNKVGMHVASGGYIRDCHSAAIIALLAELDREEAALQEGEPRAH